MQAAAAQMIQVGNFDSPADRLPIFTGSEWADHVNAWTHTRATVTEKQFQLGAIAASLQTRYGDQSLTKFATEVGEKPKTVFQYRQVYLIFQNSKRLENLSWTHYQVAVRSVNPVELLTEASAKQLSTRELAQMVARSSAPNIADPVKPLIEDDQIRDWFAEFQGIIARAPSSLGRILQDVVDEVHDFVSRPRHSRQFQILACIKRGVDEQDQIAKEINVDRVHVGVWLDRLRNDGLIARFEKPRAPGARGATRKGHSLTSDGQVWLHNAAKNKPAG